MRKINSTAEFEAVRRRFLLENFRDVIARQSQISLKRAFRDTAERPAPRFWVSEDRAALIVSKMMADESCVEGMYEEKKEMYREIYRRFCKIRRQSPARPVADIIFDIVNGEAPRSYLSWQRVKTIVYNEKRGRRI